MEKDSKVVEFIKGSAILVGANMVLKAINFFLLPLYTKYLTPEDLGISDSITTFTAFAFPLLVMGLDSAFSAFYYDKRTMKHSAKVFNTIWFSMLAASVIPFLIAFFAKPISSILFHSEEYGYIVVVALISVSFNLWFLPFALFVRMENRMGIFALVNVAASLTMIGLNVVFVSILQWGAFSLIASTAVVQLLQLLLYLLVSKALIGFSYYDKGLKRKMMRFALPLIPTTLAVWALNMSDRYILLAFMGEAEVGIYGIAGRFSSVVAVISSAVYMAYTAFAFNKKGDENANTQYARILSAFFFILFALCFTVSLFGKEVIETMTNEQYLAAYTILPGILFGQIAYGVNTIVSYGISFAKKTIYSLIATSIGAGTNIILNLIFVPIYGMEAAAHINFVGYGTMCVLGYVFSQRLYPCDYKIIRVLVTILLGYGILLFMIDWSLRCKIIVWVVVAGGGMVLFRDVLKDGRILLKAIMDRKKRTA